VYKIPRSFVVDEQAYHAAVEIHHSLHHPAVLSLFSTFETPYAFYEVLEYCSKGSLAEYFPPPESMSTNTHIQKLDNSQLRGVIRNLIEGIIYIHRNQILHLDLQLSNIYVSKDSRMVGVGQFSHVLVTS
jgi:polo-like kinase 4